MRAFGAAAATGIVAAMAMVPLVPIPADAAVITRTYDITAAGFVPIFGSVPAPEDTAQISITVTFDNAADIPDQTAGITLNSSNLALGSALGFRYLAASDSLVVGGIQSQTGGTVGNSDDWAVLFGGASTGDPEFSLFFYTIASSAEAWLASDGSVDSVTVPEASALAIISFGLFSLGAFARRDRRLGLALNTAASRAPAAPWPPRSTRRGRRRSG